MCTVTWLRSASGYQLFFNRDELRSRQQAQPPQLHRENGTTYIAPIDGDAGGTWISVNQYGLTLCLLNNYRAATKLAERDWNSRGLLVSRFAPRATVGEIVAEIKETDLSRNKPFDLLIFDNGQLPVQIAWDGFRLEVKHNPEMPLTSSSFNTAQVIRNRLTQLEKGKNLGADMLHRFHASHNPEKGAYSVCMHRDDACTVSFSHIVVDESQIRFEYLDGAPCESQAATSLTIDNQNARAPHVA